MEASLAGKAGSVYSSLLAVSCFVSPSIFNATPGGSAGCSQGSVSEHHPRTQTSVVTKKPRRNTSVSAQEGKGSLTVPTELPEPRHRRFLSAPAAAPGAPRSDGQQEASAPPRSPHGRRSPQLGPLPPHQPQPRPRGPPRPLTAGQAPPPCPERPFPEQRRTPPPSPLSPEVTD